MESEECPPHPILFLPEILQTAFSHLDAWDLESGLLVCRAWRQALAGRVHRLVLPARALLGLQPHTVPCAPRASSLEDRMLVPADEPQHAADSSLFSALRVFSAARGLTLIVDAAAGQEAQLDPPQPPGDTPAPPGGDGDAACSAEHDVQTVASAQAPGILQLQPLQPRPQTAAQEGNRAQAGDAQLQQQQQQLLLRRTRELTLVAPAPPRRSQPPPPRASGAAPGPHILSAWLAALCSTAANTPYPHPHPHPQPHSGQQHGPLSAVQRLRVSGPGWAALQPGPPPPLRALAAHLPSLTHLDLCPGADPHAQADRADLAPPHLTCPQHAAGSRWLHPACAAAPAALHSPSPAPCPALDLGLAAVQALSSLPALTHLSAQLAIGPRDAAAAWAAALASLSSLSRLSALVLAGPLCLLPDMGGAVAGWGGGLPRLARLALAGAECAHAHPDLEGELYGDPEGWRGGGGGWAGVLPALTQLQELQLTLDAASPELWRDAAACARGGALTSLRLRTAAWGGALEAPDLAWLAGPATEAGALRRLALTLGDCPRLQALSALSQLTSLELELLALDYPCEDPPNGPDPCKDPTDAGGPCGSDSIGNQGRPTGSSSTTTTTTTSAHAGLLAAVTRGLVNLRALRLACRSAAVDPSHLGCLAVHCPALECLRLRGPMRAGGGAGRGRASGRRREGAALPYTAQYDSSSSSRDAPRAVRLPVGLRVLELENTDAAAAAGAPLLRLCALPAALRLARLAGLTLDVEAAAAGDAGPYQAASDADVQCVAATHAAPDDPTAVPGQQPHAPAPAGMAAGAGAPPPPPPRLAELCCSRCTLLCDPARLAGPGLRALSLEGCALPYGSAAALCARLGPLLARLRLAGCRGPGWRPADDAVMAALAAAAPGLRALCINAAAATEGGLAALSRLRLLREAQLGVASHACAAALGSWLGPVGGLEWLEVRVAQGAGGFVADCTAEHLSRRLPGVDVRLGRMA